MDIALYLQILHNLCSPFIWANNITLANIDICMSNLQIALIAFTSASSGKQIESYYSTFCVMRAAFNLTGDEKNSEFVTAYCSVFFPNPTKNRR